MSTQYSVGNLPTDVPQVMRIVLYALLPGITVFIYQTGWGGIINILLAIFGACLFEAIAAMLRGRNPVFTLSDFSAVVTGLLIALCLPPLVAWWLPMLASAFAILLAKHIYGGLGHNIFNPAMAGYALVLISFPRDLGLWSLAPDLFQTPLADAISIVSNGGLVTQNNWDAVTGATALDEARNLLRQNTGLRQTKDQVAGWFGARQSEWTNLAYLCGGLWLLWRRVISWHIPLVFLTTIMFCSVLHTLIDSNQSLGIGFHLFSGATMLCAFFIATDPVSAATGTRGRIIYAVGIAVLAYMIRANGAYPDSIAFAVLLMNCVVPAIDRIEPYLRYGGLR